jgi:hypothetical protein
MRHGITSESKVNCSESKRSGFREAFASENSKKRFRKLVSSRGLEKPEERIICQVFTVRRKEIPGFHHALRVALSLDETNFTRLLRAQHDVRTLL